jgi:hypothetical protein
MMSVLPKINTAMFVLCFVCSALTGNILALLGWGAATLLSFGRWDE